MNERDRMTDIATELAIANNRQNDQKAGVFGFLLWGWLAYLFSDDFTNWEWWLGTTWLMAFLSAYAASRVIRRWELYEVRAERRRRG